MTELEPATQCRSCGAPIRWVLRPDGGPMAIDPAPSTNGSLVLYDYDGAVHGCLTMGAGDPPFPLYNQHAHTCPNRDDNQGDPR